MKQKGYILLEILVATSLLSLAGSGIYQGISQAMKAQKMVKESGALNDPFKILWMRTDKDLRNTIVLREEKFIGKQDEMIFPIMSAPAELSRVRYFVKDGKLLRSTERLSKKLVKDVSTKSILLDNLKDIRFEYAYLDKDEKITFKPLWIEEPYFGLPRAVKITAKLKNEKIFWRIISIPQGRWGHE